MGREQFVYERTVEEAIRRAKLLFSQRVGNQSSTGNASDTQSGLVPPVPTDATHFLNGDAPPAFAQVKDSDLSVSDIATNNVSTAAHGFAPKAPNDATKFLDGTGAYTVPPSGQFPPALPTFPSISNLEGRFSAEPTVSTLTLNTDGRAAQVNDASGNWGSNLTATTTARPRWMKRAMNSLRPGLVFDGSANIMQATANKTIAQPLTVVVVLQNWKNGVNQDNLYRDTNSGPVTFINAGNSWALFAGSTLSSTTLFSQNRDVIPDGMIAAPAVVMSVFNGASSIIGNNGVEATGAGGATGISGQMIVGAGAPGSGSFAHMVLYEILFFSKALNSTERGQLNTYYATALDLTL
jgi:hypothetical protein